MTATANGSAAAPAPSGPGVAAAPRAAVASPVAEAAEVVLALPDLYGRLQGTRLAGDFFREQVVSDGYGACDYLLSADVEMQASARYTGNYGDFVLRPDLRTARPLPWRNGTALVLADAVDRDGTPVPVAPRQILRTQLDRLTARGLTALVGTELEFLVFTESYREAFAGDYRGLRTASRYNSDYALTGLGELDDLVGRLLRGMAGAGLRIESARGEVHPGQYEIVFRYAEAMDACDGHVFYKTGAKQIAEAAGRAITFMPKFDQGEGNSCHVHLSLRDASDRPVFDRDGGLSALAEHFLAGVLACAPAFTLLCAPSLNAYKRLSPDAFAPTAAAWGTDDRTRAVRVVGAGPSLRFEHRIAGGDANPYLVVAGIVASGLYGIERELPLPPPGGDGEPLPRTLESAARCWRGSAVAREAFGDTVVEHLAAAADAELAAFAATTTDWERHRGFERL
ncbi:glutamine synthetase family protein [Cryptosporangium aurantiacum]|uniref:Glutamine synthetase n=1 Tax=Cryptosporangium aurantiacum TaxID=134849 RepID=A0A1M7N630_9ACTN|nr:glutamine synthetase family protein [Cryptosporangium aurantiacum]SHM98899.1 glutamine synthetase [Cryptosporangium aurantiacum]